MTTIYTSNKISGIKKTHSIDNKVQQRLEMSGIKEIYWAEVEDPTLKKNFIHRRCLVIEHIDTTYNVFSFGEEGFVNVYRAINTEIDSSSFIEVLYNNMLKQLA